MKRILLGTFVAIAAMFSACQVIIQPETEVDVEKETVLFTASMGAETKTYLEYDDNALVYKVKWEDGDGIWVGALQENGMYTFETCYLVEGAGSTTATFEGTLQSDQYIAYYGYGWYDSYEGFMPAFQQYQGAQYSINYETGEVDVLESFGRDHYHMYAVSDDKSFEFKNLAAVLKVSLTGNTNVDNVVFTPNDPSILVAGKAKIHMDENNLPIVEMLNESSSYNNIIYQLHNLPLSESEPLNCYIVLPPMIYKGGFTITINSAIGSMSKTVTQDVEFKRSEIRSLSPITFVPEKVMDWAIIGSMSDWSEDVSMKMDNDGRYLLENYHLSSTDEFKFRANADWATNFGGTWEYSIYPVDPNTTIPMVSGGSNLQVTTSGIYNIYLNPGEAWAYLELVRSDDEIVVCSSYDEVAALPDETLVLVEGLVLTPYSRGFIMNIGYQWDNTILVYQAGDQSMYMPVSGNEVKVCAYKTTYNNLPELYPVQYIEVINSTEYDYGYSGYFDLTRPASFENTVLSDRYYYVKAKGTLQQNGSYWNVIVPGVEDKQVRLEWPSVDLTPYKDQNVLVEGWFAGNTISSTGMKYVKIVLRDIAIAEGNDSSTEDVIPGDDIQFIETKALLKLKK
jgi:hypothetical protein